MRDALGDLAARVALQQPSALLAPLLDEREFRRHLGPAPADVGRGRRIQRPGPRARVVERGDGLVQPRRGQVRQLVLETGEGAGRLERLPLASMTSYVRAFSMKRYSRHQSPPASRTQGCPSREGITVSALRDASGSPAASFPRRCPVTRTMFSITRSGCLKISWLMR